MKKKISLLFMTVVLFAVNAMATVPPRMTFVYTWGYQLDKWLGENFGRIYFH